MAAADAGAPQFSGDVGGRGLRTKFSAVPVFMRQAFLCNSPDSVQFAFSQKNVSFERKAPQMRYALEPLLGDGLFISDGETWRKRRRIVAPIVHVSRLAKFAPIMVEAAQEVRERWASSEGATVDVLVEIGHLTAEVICRTLFGRKLGHDYARQIVDGFSEYQRVIGQIDLPSLLGLPDWVPRWYSRAVYKSVNSIQGVLDQVIESSRAQSGADDSSVISQLLNARDEETGQPLDPEALRNEIAVLFMAGHETTANSLTWIWYLLSQAPEVEAKLHAELDRVLGGRPPTLADLPKLVYTRAIFDEAMRLYPPVPILPREAVRDENYRGVRIPKGSLVFVVPWLLHRHKKLWDKPDHFIPERFLPENSGFDLEIRLYPVQHRSAHLRRHVVRTDGSNFVPGDAGAEVQAAAEARPCRQSGLPADPASRRRHADDDPRANRIRRRGHQAGGGTTGCPVHHG